MVTATFLLMSWSLGFFLWSDINRQVDTAQLLLMTESTARTGVPYNQVGSSVIDAEATWGLDAQTVCADSLAPGPNSYPNGEFNHLHYHAYYFVYALAPFVWMLPVNVVVAAAQALALAAVVLMAYIILRKEGVNPFGSAVFCGFLMSYPVWNETLTIDLYMDRFFPPLALGYIALLYYGLVARSRSSRLWLLAVPVGIAAASTNDRSMLYVIGITLGMLALLGRRRLFAERGPVLGLVCVVAFMAAAFVLYQRLVNTIELNSIGFFAGRVLQVIDMLRSTQIYRFDQTYAELSLKFVVVNAVLFGIWGWWRWRYMLLGLGALLPNLTTTIGGAEKITFGFPYHSQYLPILLFAVILGFGAAWRCWAAWPRRAVIGGVTAALALALFTLNPYEAGWHFDQDGVSQSGLSATWTFYADVDHSGAASRRHLFEQVAGAVPPGVSVTAMSDTAGSLYDRRHWMFYPMGIDLAQYAVLIPRKDASGNSYFGDAPNYQGQGEALDKCLTRRLATDGYDLNQPTIVGPFAVLRRSG